MGLRKRLARIRGLRLALTDDEQQTVAKETVEYLELCNWISTVRGEPPLKWTLFWGPGAKLEIGRSVW